MRNLELELAPTPLFCCVKGFVPGVHPYPFILASKVPFKGHSQSAASAGASFGL